MALRPRQLRQPIPGVGSGGQLYDRDLLGGRAPADVDEVAYGLEGSLDRRAEERAHARTMIAELQVDLEDARDRVESYGQAYVDRLERELATWRLLAGDAGRYSADDLGDVPLF